MDATIGDHIWPSMVKKIRRTRRKTATCGVRRPANIGRRQNYMENSMHVAQQPSQRLGINIIYATVGEDHQSRRLHARGTLCAAC